MYVMLGTQVDTAFSVSILSRYLINGGPTQVNEVKRIIQYLKEISRIELTFWGTLKPLVRYTNAYQAGAYNLKDLHLAISLILKSEPLAGISKQQLMVSIYTCKAKFIAQTQATKGAIWLRSFLSQLLLDREELSATIRFGDNKGAIALAKKSQFYARTKLIAIKHHFVRDQQSARTSELKVNTFQEASGQQADQRPTKRQVHCI